MCKFLCIEFKRKDEELARIEDYIEDADARSDYTAMTEKDSEKYEYVILKEISTDYQTHYNEKQLACWKAKEKKMEKKYESTRAGKTQFVAEKLAPMLIAMDDAWTKVEYQDDGRTEEVIMINKNPEKNLKVNVSCDSIRAVVCDVVKAVFDLKYNI